VEYSTAVASAFRGDRPLDAIHILPPPPEPPDRQTREPAYRSYFFGPIFFEYGSATQTAARQGWHRVFGGPRRPGQPQRRPLVQTIRATRRYAGQSTLLRMAGAGPYLGAMLGVVVGFTLAAAFMLVVSVVYLLIIVLLVAGLLLIGLAARAFEQLSLWVRGITLECQSCHRRVTAPIYACPRCPPGAVAMHAKLVPGSLGVFRRLCRCGHTLPALLAGGKWKLTAYCNNEACRQVLPVKSMTARTFHVQVVAGRRAGKTVFMMSAIARLWTRSEPDLAFEFADQRALSEFTQASAALRAETPQGIRITRAADPIHAYTGYLGKEHSRVRRLLYLYDPAGETMENTQARRGLATFTFIDHLRGLVFIVDPFSFQEVTAAADPVTLGAVQRSSANPEGVFERFVEKFRERRRLPVDRKIRTGLAVVLTKADALATLVNCPHPYENIATSASAEQLRADRSAAVRDWLIDTVGQRGMVAKIENTFTDVGYFTVSALDAFTVRGRQSARTRRPVLNDDPSAPITWLVDTAGKDRRR
jgi:hypothetical protein